MLHLHSFPTRRSSDLALTSAIDTLAALVDNYIYQDNSLELDPNRILLKRGIDVNDRTLRKITRSEEHTSELQSRFDLVCRLLLAKKKRGDDDNHIVRL